MTFSKEMKNLLLRTILLLQLTLPCHARLGEGSDEIDARYGDKIFEHSKGDDRMVKYSHNGYLVVVIEVGGKSVFESLTSGIEWRESRVGNATLQQMSFFGTVLREVYSFPESKIKEALRRDLDGSQHDGVKADVNYKIEMSDDLSRAGAYCQLYLTSSVVADPEVLKRLIAIKSEAESKTAKAEKERAIKGF